MINNKERIGNFTSSEIVNLLSTGTRDMTDTELEQYKKANPKGKKKTIEHWPGRAAQTYIDEVNMERRLGRSISKESNARPLTWGKCVEPFVFETKLGLEYTYNSQDTIVHPTIKDWSGSPDGFKEVATRTVVDTKCPNELKSFCQLVDPIYEGLTGMDAMNKVRENHKDGEKYYWQLVSNAILSGCDIAELIVYCPYCTDLERIRYYAEGIPEYYWIWSANDDELPFLLEGGYYKDLNVITFQIPDEDKELLTKRVIEAQKMLIPKI